MAKSWSVGRDVIAKMIGAGELKQMAGYAADGTDLLETAIRVHGSAVVLQSEDPRSAITLAYDAGRLTCEALLAHQGLRARSTDGHHTIVFSAVSAQFGGAFVAMDHLRRRRHELEYPTRGVDIADDDEAQEAIDHTATLLGAAEQLMPALYIWN